MLKFRTLTLVAAFSFALAAAALSGRLALAGGKGDAAPTDWCQYLGANQDNAPSGSFQSTWPAEGPKKAWTKTIGAGYSSFSTWKGRLFTMGNANDTDTVWCLDPATGKEVWTHTYPCKVGVADYPGPRCTPAVDGQNVFTLSQDGQLFCLDIETGKPRWSKDVVKDLGVKLPMWHLGNSPALLGDMILLDFGRCIALKKSDGSEVWTTPMHKLAYTTPKVFTLDKRTAVAAYPGDCLQVLDAADGKVISSYPWKTQYDITAITPVVSDGQIFVSTGYGTGAAVVDAATGKEVWKNKELAIHCNNPVLRDGFLYAITGDFRSTGQLKCVEFKTGQAKWAQKGFAVGSLTMADGKLIVLDANGTVVVAEASPDGYKELSRAKVIEGPCWTMPVLIGGRLYIRNNKPGEMVCLDVRAEK
jgi:outer membrane protein assembly factor BamB